MAIRCVVLPLLAAHAVGAAAALVTELAPARVSLPLSPEPARAVPAPSTLPRAAFVADFLVTCHFFPALGLFDDLEWQSGSTLETLSDVMVELAAGGGPSPPARWLAVPATMYDKLPAVVDNCFDDHQWWLLAWVRAYEATGNASYVQRAATIFDYIVAHGWDTKVCGGGVTWCPPPTSPYKNAITTELFFSGAMALAPHEAVVGKPANFYVGWAQTAWAWLEASGLINGAGLVNDGLDSATCENNKQTTWTYNQGVLLSGLARLAAATGNSSLLGAATRVADAAMRALSVDGVLTEPCGGGVCDGDQGIFKGVFVRHLAKLAAAAAAGGPGGRDEPFAARAAGWLGAQAAAVGARALCGLGGAPVFPLKWDGPCDGADTATGAAALDALVAAAVASAPPPSPPRAFRELGLGNCADGNGGGMANCYLSKVPDERACRDAAWTVAGAVAYDFSLSDCVGGTFCRVRTLAGAAACPGGWGWANGTASSVTTTVDAERAVCVLRVA